MESMKGRKFPDINEAIENGETVFAFIIRKSGDTEIICKGDYSKIMDRLADGVAKTIASADLGTEEVIRFSIEANLKLINYLSDKGEDEDGKNPES